MYSNSPLPNLLQNNWVKMGFWIILSDLVDLARVSVLVKSLLNFERKELLRSVWKLVLVFKSFFFSSLSSGD